MEQERAESGGTGDHRRPELIELSGGGTDLAEAPPRMQHTACIGQVACVGRTPTLFKVRTITVPMGRRLSDALEAYQRREGISNATESIRHALWAFFTQENLLPPEDAPESAPQRKTRR